MKATTTAEQRQAWAEVHKALTNYIVNFGPIQVGKENGYFVLDEFIMYPECGKISCPDYCFGLDNKKAPWYNWCRNRGKDW